MPDSMRPCRPSFDPADAEVALSGDSGAITSLRNVLTALAPLDVDLAIDGEPGTGKHATARMLHRQSTRSKDPFLRVAVTDMSEARAHEHLFGADGVMRQAAQARRATVYLHAVDSMPARVQLELAEALGTSELRGVRVIAGTHRALDDQFRIGRVQPALFSRLATIRLSMPALRDRLPDLAAITAAALARWCERTGRPEMVCGPGAVDELATHIWPGNVRELLCFLSLVCERSRGSRLTAERIRAALRARPRKALATGIVPLDQLELEYLLSAVQRCDGNKSLAARRLGIGRNTLLRRLQESGNGALIDARRPTLAGAPLWSPTVSFADVPMHAHP